MGGCGSGRHNRWASKTEDFHTLDLASFKSEWFSRGRSGYVRWSRAGHETGSISYRLGHDFMRLTYTNIRNGEKLPIDETFQCDFTSQHFGGKRRWITCRGCGHRCRVLYGGRYFRCRQCYRATYPSQYERFFARGVSRAMRVREKLNGEIGLAYPFPDKPKGMHWRTYRSLMEADCCAQMQLDRLLTEDTLRWR